MSLGTPTPAHHHHGEGWDECSTVVTSASEDAVGEAFRGKPLSLLHSPHRWLDKRKRQWAKQRSLRRPRQTAAGAVVRQQARKPKPRKHTPVPAAPTAPRNHDLRLFGSDSSDYDTDVSEPAPGSDERGDTQDSFSDFDEDNSMDAGLQNEVGSCEAGGAMEDLEWGDTTVTDAIEDADDEMVRSGAALAEQRPTLTRQGLPNATHAR